MKEEPKQTTNSIEYTLHSKMEPEKGVIVKDNVPKPCSHNTKRQNSPTLATSIFPASTR
jgi:hypothetical protein